MRAGTKRRKPNPRPPVECEPLLLKPAHAAKLLSLGLTSVWQLRKRGILKTVTLNGRPLITAESVRRAAGRTDQAETDAA